LTLLEEDVILECPEWTGRKESAMSDRRTEPFEFEIGDPVGYTHRTHHGNFPYHGTVTKRQRDDRGWKVYYVEFAARACPLQPQWCHEYELRKLDKSAQEASDEYLRAPLPRWA
jgi:hypothetical protein